MKSSSEKVSKVLKLNSDEEAIKLFGSLDENLRFAENEYSVRISARNHRLTISGTKSDVEQALAFFEEKLSNLRVSSQRVSIQNSESKSKDNKGSFGHLQYYHKGKIIKAKSKLQADYLEAMAKYDIVMGIGPAGTGKTYLAVAHAIDCLKKRQVARIILTRPAVEAGESLGFLPGDLIAKIDPYLRPLYDALYEMLDSEEVQKYIEKGIIEVAPLAYMRGRTLNDAFVILDEGQNTTHEQMKMFLTRMGQSTRVIVTGDVTQVDLPGGKKSGLIECQKILKAIRGIKFIHLKDQDIVRHQLVRDIVKAYNKHDV